jgi:hypothetical protein
LFTMGSFLKITGVAKIFVLLFPTMIVMYWFWQKKTKTFWANKSGQPDEDCLFFQSEERYVGESQ